MKMVIGNRATSSRASLPYPSPPFTPPSSIHTHECKYTLKCGSNLRSPMKTTLYKMTHFLKRTQLQVWHFLNVHIYTHSLAKLEIGFEEEEMDKYEVVKDLGAGNFGVARLLRHKETKELVAMKYIERGRKVWSFSSLVSQKKFWLSLIG